MGGSLEDMGMGQNSTTSIYRGQVLVLVSSYKGSGHFGVTFFLPTATWFSKRDVVGSMGSMGTMGIDMPRPQAELEEPWGGKIGAVLVGRIWWG